MAINMSPRPVNSEVREVLGVKIRVLVVDDSLFIRTLISRMLQEDPEIQVVGTASNGLHALKEVRQLQPDVITMDIDMPVMDGIEAVRRIMSERPTPVVILSSLSKQHVDATILALGSGAVDFLEKPANVWKHFHEIQAVLTEKVKLAARTSVRPAGWKSLSDKLTIDETSKLRAKSVTGTTTRQIVAMGTSTGGPRALEHVFSVLPEDFPCPIVVVQHMPSPFTRSLAERLNVISRIRVKEAVDKEPLTPGTAYVAPGGWHMEVAQRADQLYVHLHQGAKRHGHRPSVDVLFGSLANLPSVHRVLVLMTGMGSDGAEGMQLVKRSGNVTTIVEAEQTCSVFGMPKAAIELGCVDFVVPLQEIAGKIVEVIQSPDRQARACWR